MIDIQVSNTRRTCQKAMSYQKIGKDSDLVTSVAELIIYIEPLFSILRKNTEVPNSFPIHMISKSIIDINPNSFRILQAQLCHD